MFVVVAVCALLQGQFAAAALPGVSRTAGAPATPAARLAVVRAEEAWKASAQKARDRFLEGDFQGAVAAVDALQKTFEESGAAFRADDAAWSAWADSRLTRALALRRLGKEQAADDELRALAVVRPTFAPDASFAPPKVLSRFHELREQLLGGPTIAVTVEITPSSGTLVLDGRPVPEGVLDVLPGTHWFGLDGTGQRLAIDKPRDLRLQAPTPPPGKLDDGPDQPGDKPDQPGDKPADVVDKPVDPPPTVSEDGPPWLWLGLAGAGAAVVAAVVVAVVVAAQPPGVLNPGGTTAVVDASRLDPRDAP